jgi:hypothetical protein
MPTLTNTDQELNLDTSLIDASSLVQPTPEDFANLMREQGLTALADAYSPPPSPKPFVDGFGNTLADVGASALGGITTAIEDLNELAHSAGDYLIDRPMDYIFQRLFNRRFDLFDDNPDYAGKLTPEKLKPKTQLGQLAQQMVAFGARLFALNMIGAGLASKYPEALTALELKAPEGFSALSNPLNPTLTTVPAQIQSTLGGDILAGAAENFTQALPTAGALPQTTSQALLEGTMKGVVTGFLGDFTRHPKETLIDPEDPLIDAPWYKETLAQFLNSDPTDPDVQKRFKNALSMVVPNAVTSFFMTAISHYWMLHKADTAAKKREAARIIEEQYGKIKAQEQEVPLVDREQALKDTVNNFKERTDAGYKVSRGAMYAPKSEGTRLNANNLSDPANKLVKGYDGYVRVLEEARKESWGDATMTALSETELKTQAESFFKNDPFVWRLYEEIGREGREAGLKLAKSEIKLANILQTKIAPDVLDAFHALDDVMTTPGGDVAAAYDNLLDHLTVLVRAQTELVGVRGWAGRALRLAGQPSRFSQPFIDFEPFMAVSGGKDNLKDVLAKNMDPAKIRDLLASFEAATNVYHDGRAITWVANQVKQVVNGTPPMSFWDAIKDIERSYTYFSMLSGPRTHVGNFLGNLVKVFGTDVSDLYFSRIKSEGVEGAADAVAAYWGGLKRGFDTGFKVLRAAWKYDTSVLSPQDGMKFPGNPMLGGDDANLFARIMKMPGKLLNAGDELFKQAAYRGQVELQIHDYMKSAEARAFLGANPSKEAINTFKEAIVDKFYGSLFIDKNTAISGATATGFRDATGILNAEKALQGALKSTWNNTPYEDATFRALRSISKIPGGHHLIPFTKTVYNIGKDALIEHNPLGIIRLLGATDDPAAQAKIMGQFWTSVALWSGIYGLYESGLINGGGPSNRTARQLWLEQGNVPYSIKTPVGNISLANLDPVAAPIIMIADMFGKIDEIDPSTGRDKSNYIVSAFNALTQYATNRTWLKSVGDFFDVFSDEGTAGQKIGRFIRRNAAGSYIPSFLATTSQMIDPYTHEAQDFTAPFTHRIPLLSEEINPPKVSWLTGELITGQYGDSWMATALTAPFFQRKFHNEEHDIVYENLIRSNVDRAPTRTMRNGLSLNDYDYSQLCKLVGTVRINGQTLYEALRSKFSQGSWETAYGIDPSETSLAKPKEAWITKTVNRYKKAAEKEFLRRNPNAKKYLDLWDYENDLYKKGRIQQMNLPAYDSEEDYSQYQSISSF